MPRVISDDEILAELFESHKPVPLIAQRVAERGERSLAGRVFSYIRLEPDPELAMVVSHAEWADPNWDAIGNRRRGRVRGKKVC